MDGTVPSTTVAAADKATIEFQFSLDDVQTNASPIKDGHVRLRIPNGWTPTNTTADADGTVTAFIDGDGNITDGSTADQTDLKDHITTPGQEIKVDIASLSGGEVVVIKYANGVVQDTAEEEVEIKSWFHVGIGQENASNPAYVDVTNVADSSGTATIVETRSNRAIVDAGSTGNEILVRFMAQGSMDGGTVRLDIPDGWGDLQRTDPKGANYVRVEVSPKERDWSINTDTVFVYLDTFGARKEVRIRISKFEAQPDLGIAEFIISSAGSRNGDLQLVKGVVFTDVDTRAAAKDIDLIGKVYHDNDDVPQSLAAAGTNPEDEQPIVEQRWSAQSQCGWRRRRFRSSNGFNR